MNKKIAICISGEMRFFNHPLVVEGYKKFIQIHNPDVYISTWNHIGKSMNHKYIDPNETKSVETALEESIRSIYQDIKYLCIENYNDWIDNIDSNIKESIYCEGYSPRTINSYSQIYKISNSINLKSKYEKENNFNYDVVVRLRPDNLMVNHFNFEIDPNTIYNINFGIAYYPKRIYDILFYGDSKSMDKIANTFSNYIDLLYHEFSNRLCNRDACRLLYLQSMLSGLEVKTTNTRLSDVYRGQSFDEYYGLIKTYGEFLS
jgi:hypothetical protein